MNVDPTGLREHLDSALAPIAPPFPPGSVLRRAVADRRRHRRRSGAAALALVVVASVLVAVPVARSGGGRTSISPAAPTAAVVVACAPGAVTLAVGQTLLVRSCPPSGDHTTGTTVEQPSVLQELGGQRYRATRAGVASLQVAYTGCQAPPGEGCTADQRQIATITVTVTGGLSTTGPVLTAPCVPGAARLVPGQTLRLGGCPRGATASAEGAALRGAGALSFIATAPGVATVEILEPTPACTPQATTCADAGAFAGDITVTVAAAGGVSPPATSVRPSTTPPPSPGYALDDPSTWQVSVDGYGPLRRGMSAAQLEAIVGPTLHFDDGGSGPSCLLGESSRLPDVAVTLLDGTFQLTMVGAISAPEPTGGPSTLAGIHLGMSEAALRAALGPRATSEEATGGPGTDYLLTTTGGGKVLAMVADGVVRFYAEGSQAFGEDGCV